MGGGEGITRLRNDAWEEGRESRGCAMTRGGEAGITRVRDDARRRGGSRANERKRWQEDDIVVKET